jgi:hypothetical protein
LGEKTRLISKITRTKRTRGMAQEECPLGKCKALSSNPSIAKNKKEKKSSTFLKRVKLLYYFAYLDEFIDFL